MGFSAEAKRRRTIQAGVVRITFTLPPVTGEDGAYWNANKSVINLATGNSPNAAGDNMETSIVAMGSAFTANQTTPVEPQHVIGAFRPIDNPIMSWDGTASLRSLVSKDRRMGSLLHLFADNIDGVRSAYEGTAAGDWEEWAANWKGCMVTIEDKLAAEGESGVLGTFRNVKVTAENVAVQARAIVARDVQFNHLGQW